jgi:hypothetical protein
LSCVLKNAELLFGYSNTERITQHATASKSAFARRSKNDFEYRIRSFDKRFSLIGLRLPAQHYCHFQGITVHWIWEHLFSALQVGNAVNWICDCLFSELQVGNAVHQIWEHLFSTLKAGITVQQIWERLFSTLKARIAVHWIYYPLEIR